ncbi:MAG: GAF domain-containing protein [Campylobacterota bacterium]|nr:GAF domain-containing protein [Campylobacterota bacterium]
MLLYRENLTITFFKVLQAIEFDTLIQNGYIHKDNKYFSIKPIIGFNDSLLGYYIIGQDYNEIKKILTESQNITYSFILIMIIMSFVIIIALHFIIKSLIISNLTKVTNGLSGFFDFLNKKTDSIKYIEINSDDEIGKMAQEINANVKVIKNILDNKKQDDWLKDEVQLISTKLSGIIELKQLSDKSISFICESINAAVGTLYIYDQSNKNLELYGSYAYIAKDEKTIFRLGEGTVGQVALQKTPIKLTNIYRDDLKITTGSSNQASLDTYTHPLIYQNKVYGVIEIGTTHKLNTMQHKLLEIVSSIIATSLFSSIQTKKNKESFRYI